MERHRGDYHPHRGDHYWPPYHNEHYHQNNHPFNNYNHDPHSNYGFNHNLTGGEPNAPFGGGGGGFLPNFRKRGRFNSVSDHGDGVGVGGGGGGGDVKLYVAPIPRTTVEEEVRLLFEPCGSIIEIILPRDKRSGQQQAYCFVKYATLEEADQAIRALNSQYTFPGESVPIKVRYADGERERHGKVEREHLGGFVDKLYVGSVNKQASKEEIEEIFSPYGCVEEVYIARDELKQIRCAFVKYSHRDMAVAAIEALHGTFTMRGCDQPLTVRFADPKKPRMGELRGNHAFGRPNFGPCSQEPMTRLAPNFGDAMGGCVMPNASYPVQETNLQPQVVPHVIRPELAAPLLPLVQQPPSQFSQMPLQHTQAPPEYFQSSQQAVFETQKQTQKIEQQQSAGNPPMESPRIGSNPQAVCGTSDAPAVSPSPPMVDQQDCDWSEHTCPDGYKYYYNCITCESLWEKPEEFSLFQQEFQKQQKMHHQNQQCDSLSAVLSSKEINLSPKDLDHLQIQPKTSLFVDSTCV